MTDNNIIPINNSQSEVLELIASGEYDLAVEKISDSPEAFNVLVSSIGKKLQEEKKSAERIRDRDFFKRLFSSNTKDFASIVLSQNETMSNFFVMLQLTAMATKGNAKVLYRICECLKRGTDAGELEDSSIRRMAITFMEDNIKALEEEKIRDEAIMKLLKAYVELNKVTNKIDERLGGIDRYINETKEADFMRDERLGDIDRYINETKEADTKRDERLGVIDQYITETKKADSKRDERLGVIDQYITETKKADSKRDERLGVIDQYITETKDADTKRDERLGVIDKYITETRAEYQALRSSCFKIKRSNTILWFVIIGLIAFVLLYFVITITNQTITTI